MGDGRTAPDSAISPKKTLSAAGPRRSARNQRRRDREVGGRLVDAQAAGDVEIDVVLAEPHAAMRFEHGQHHGQARGVPADDGAARRAERRWARPAPGFRPAPGACPPCRRTPRRPAPSASRPARNSADGFVTSRRPAPVISNTPISSVGPKRFFTARRMRKWWPPSPSKESTASTMCSTTRGPAICPSLVTWPTRITQAPVVLA